MARLCSALWETAQLSPKGLYQFAFLSAVNESSCCPASSPTFSVVSVLNSSYSHSFVMYFIVVLIYSSLMIEVWCSVSLHMFVICVKCLLRSFAHFVTQVVFLLLSFKSCFCILYFVYKSYQIRVLKHFLSNCALSLYSLKCLL